MAWRERERPRFVRLTQKLAETFAAMQSAPHDRPLTNSRIAFFRNEIAAGRFRTCEWASAFCEATGETYRVNGKHTSSIFATMNGEMPDIMVSVQTYDCETLEDVADLYSTFDSQQSARKSSDINRIHSAAHPDLIGLPARVINVAVSGMAFAFWERGAWGHTSMQRAVLMLKCPEFPVWLNTVASENPSDSKIIMRTGPAAAMFKTWLKDTPAATTFWQLVRDGSGKDHHSADRILNKHLLMTTTMSGGGTGGAKKKIASVHEMYIRCLHAWNAWRSNEKTSLRYTAGCKTPPAK